MTTKELPGGAAVPADVEVHPLADVFPLIEGSEFEELVEDIRRNGLRTPILLDAEGRLLDGRNRLRACRAAGVEPQFAPPDPEMAEGRGLRGRDLVEDRGRDSARAVAPGGTEPRP